MSSRAPNPTDSAAGAAAAAAPPRPVPLNAAGAQGLELDADDTRFALEKVCSSGTIHDGTIWSMKTLSGGRLATASGNNVSTATVKVFDIAPSGDSLLGCCWTFADPGGYRGFHEVSEVTPDTICVSTAHGNGHVIIIDSRTGAERADFNTHNGAGIVRTCVLGGKIVAAGEHGKISMLDAATGEIIRFVGAFEGAAGQPVALSENLVLVAPCEQSPHAETLLHDVRARTSAHVLRGACGAVTRLSDGRIVSAFAPKPDSFAVWHDATAAAPTRFIATGTPTKDVWPGDIFGLPSPAHASVFVTATAHAPGGNRVRLWSADTGANLATADAPNHVCAITPLPRGHFASAGADAAVTIWRISALAPAAW